MNKKIKNLSISIIMALNLFNIPSIYGYSYSLKSISGNLEGFWDTSLKVDPQYNEYSLVAASGDKIYSLGAYGEDENGYMQTYEKMSIYDTKSNTWSSGEGIYYNPFAQVVVYNNKIYHVGIQDYNSDDEPASMIWIYDIGSDTWEEGEIMPSYLIGFSIFAFEDKIYCVGGMDMNTYEMNTDLLVYDINADSWSRVESSFPEMINMSAIVVGDKAYIMGGMDKSYNQKRDLIIYDIKKNIYTTGSELIEDVTVPSLAYVAEDIYCYTGNTMSVYNIYRDEWKQVEDIPSIVRGGRMASVENEVYIIAANGTHKYTPMTKDEHSATNSVVEAEKTGNLSDIENARDMVNKLPDTEAKKELQDRLDLIEVELEIEKKNISSNADIYIKMANTLSLSLNTTNITFDDYDGTETVEKANAVGLIVSSSLPYQVNAYLETEIQNADKNKTLDKEILHIKAGSDPTYKNFVDLVTPVELLNTQVAGDDVNHSVDLKLEGGRIYQADVYKTTLRFEVIQK